MFQEYLFPWLLSNTISLILIGVCYKWSRAGNIIWAFVFFLAGLFNGFTSIQNPEAYQIYATSSVPLYRDIIHGIFAENTELIVLFIAITQLLISVILFVRGSLYKIALIAAIVFFVSISPLGIGSAFPAPLLMAISMLLLYRRAKNYENIKFEKSGEN